jgi:hypothetical protein
MLNWFNYMLKDKQQEIINIFDKIFNRKLKKYNQD